MLNFNYAKIYKIVIDKFIELYGEDKRIESIAMQSNIIYINSYDVCPEHGIRFKFNEDFTDIVLIN